MRYNSHNGKPTPRQPQSVRITEIFLLAQVVPLDLVKCRLQVDPAKYKSVFNGFKVSLAEEGVKGLAKGWAPTFFGYSAQGLCKFGLYEVFKVLYADAIGEENAYLYRTGLYLAASASAEFFADMALSPFEAAKVKIQTTPGFANTLREAFPKMMKDEGFNAFYKGLVPLWMRQIPYTMMKFACFEKTLELLYAYVVPKPRAECTKGEQLIVTFAAGYIAGVFCAIVSHPADTVVSKLNQAKGASALDVAKKLGWAGLWGGLVPRIVMIGTLTAAQWFIYDGVKVALRMPRPPPAGLHPCRYQNRNDPKLLFSFQKCQRASRRSSESHNKQSTHDIVSLKF
jgi:solute carrier family 25 (mitochondrial phosphate transporter), member 3